MGYYHCYIYFNIWIIFLKFIQIFVNLRNIHNYWKLLTALKIGIFIFFFFEYLNITLQFLSLFIYYILWLTATGKVFPNISWNIFSVDNAFGTIYLSYPFVLTISLPRHISRIYSQLLFGMFLEFYIIVSINEICK